MPLNPWGRELERQTQDKQYLEDFGPEWLTAIWLRRIETHLAHIKIIMIVWAVLFFIGGFIWMMEFNRVFG